MKTITLLFSAILIYSCTPSGTIEHVNKHNNDNIEVYRYYYEDGCAVYVARFKDSPNVVSTNWQQGKTRQNSIMIFENDSIQVFRKIVEETNK